MRVHVCQHSFLFLHFHLSHSVSLCHRIYAGPRLSALVLVPSLSLITFSFTLSQTRCGSTSVSTLSCCFTSTFAYHIQFQFVTEFMRVHVCQHSFLFLHFHLSHSVSLCHRIDAGPCLSALFLVDLLPLSLMTFSFTFAYHIQFRFVAETMRIHVSQHSFLLFYFHFHLSRFTFTYHIYHFTFTLSPDSMRVHFPAEQIEQHDSHIHVQRMSDTETDVHLGFLQMNHHYEVKFTIKDDLSDELDIDPLQNVYAKVVSAMPSEDGQFRLV